jgi:carboxyl-terminal processing protease
MLPQLPLAPLHREGASLAARLLACLAAAVLLTSAATLPAQEAERARPEAERTPAAVDLGKLFDAVVESTSKSFWDKDRLTQVGWQKRATEVRPSVAEAPSLDEAARRINALLAELKSSHTALLTPDDVEFYILADVFDGIAEGPHGELYDRFWGAGVTYAGIGHFSVKIDGRDFVDAVLEGSPAERVGLKVGDELVSVDGAPYNPIGSFRGKLGRRAAVTVRRTKDGVPETLDIPVVSIAPLRAFSQATKASARVIERDGRRIGYVHVWASVDEDSYRALSGALDSLGIGHWVVDALRPPSSQGEPVRAPVHDLIIDMRGKIGGSSGNAARYLEALDPRGPVVRSLGKGMANKVQVRGRTVVLIDHHTRSTAELFVHAYKRERQGPLIGTRTAGAVSGAHAFIMPGGNLLYVAVTGLEIDGEVLEGPGVTPDIEVARPIPYSQGADPVLEAALAYLARLPAPPPRAPEPLSGRGQW